MKYHFRKHRLFFKTPGGTSRGTLSHKDSWFIILEDQGKLGVGECSIIEGLSPETPSQVEGAMIQIGREIHLGFEELYSKFSHMPAIQFALEMAFRGLKSNDPFVLFDNFFTNSTNQIHINGLVWMGDPDFMRQQIDEKLSMGFECIKLKIGALDFDLECSLISDLRQRFDASNLQIRVDANGAFSSKDAMRKLDRLAMYDIHSIEQPIAVNQWKDMEALCKSSPIPIALDEELIGRTTDQQKKSLLENIRPQYLVLKPSLIGGWRGADRWVSLAEDFGIDWWVTSALESNVGLNAIAQWCAQKNASLPQGLGTGQLFTNNIDSPLYIEGSFLGYNPKGEWSFKFY